VAQGKRVATLIMMLGSFFATTPAANAGELAPAWMAPLATKGPPLYANGRVFVWGFPAGKAGEPFRIYALDAKTGKEIWSAPANLEPRALSAEPSEAFSLGFGGQSVLLRAGGDDVPRALDGATGKPLDPARARDLAALQNMVAGAELIYAVDQKAHQLMGLRPRDASVVWKTPLLLDSGGLAKPFGPHQVFYHEGKVLVATPFQVYSNRGVSEHRFVLSAFDAKSGEPRFRYLPGGEIGQVGVPDATGADRSLAAFVALKGLGKVICLAVDQGWLRVSSQGRSSSTIRSVIALDADTGRERWTYAPGGAVIAWKENEAIVRIRTMNSDQKPVNALADLELASGRELWRQDLPADWPEDVLVSGNQLWTPRSEMQRDAAKAYTGDRRDSKLLPGGWTANTVASTLLMQELRSPQPAARSATFKSTQMSRPVTGAGLVFIATVAEMADGRSGVWAFPAQGQ